MKIEIQSRALVTLEEALTDLSITCFKPAEDAFGKRRQSVLLTFTSSGIGGAQVQYHIDHHDLKRMSKAFSAASRECKKAWKEEE
tara:strand:- start:1739 stop:1993 length:255 start_codon:yes stop_codon:yes gene_type:complete